MNRRDFLARIAAVAAAPAVLPAAQVAPVPKPVANPASKPARHGTPADALLFEQAADLQRLAELLRGDHPLRLRFFSEERGQAHFEFDVLESCTYTPPAGVDLNMPSRACSMGDVLTLSVHVVVTTPMGQDAADALRVLTQASNEIYRLAPKVIKVTPLRLPS